MSIEETEEIWNSIAFYNFVQEPVKNLHDIPSPEVVELSQRAFMEVIEKVSPDVLIILSKRLWNLWIPGGWDEEWTRRGGGIYFQDKIATIISNHPSSPRFTYDGVNGIVKEYINK